MRCPSPWAECTPAYLAGAVVGAGDELVPRLVECAVGERQDVRAQDLEEEEVAGVVALQALDELVDHPARPGGGG